MGISVLVPGTGSADILENGTVILIVHLQLDRSSNCQDSTFPLHLGFHSSGILCKIHLITSDFQNETFAYAISRARVMYTVEFYSSSTTVCYNSSFS